MTDWMQSMTGLGAEAAAKLSSTLLVLGAIIGLRWLMLALARRRGLNPAARYRLRRFSAYAAGTLTVLVVSSIWLRGLSSFATFAGLLSAGLAIALRDVFASLAGWAFILWRRPFELGDRIEIGSQRGDVVDIRLFEFSLMEVGNWIDADDRTGRILHVPNSRIFVETVANYTKGWFPQIWDEIAVVVTFESDWQAAREILEAVIDAGGGPGAAGSVAPRATAHYLVMDASLQPTVFVSVVDIGVQLTLRYVCHPRERRAAKQRIWLQILKDFATRDDIDYAYPTQRFYDNATEGKRLLRPGASGPG